MWVCGREREREDVMSVYDSGETVRREEIVCRVLLHVLPVHSPSCRLLLHCSSGSRVFVLNVHMFLSVEVVCACLLLLLVCF